MNPFLSLIIVLFSIVLVIKFLHFFYYKLSVKDNKFFRKNTPFQVSNVRLLSTIIIDDKHKIIILGINDIQKTILLGPSTVTVLDEQLKKKSVGEQSKIENLAS